MNLAFAILALFALLFCAGVLVFLFYVFFVIVRSLRKEFSLWQPHARKNALAFGFGAIGLAILFFVMFGVSGYYVAKNAASCKDHFFYDVEQREALKDSLQTCQSDLVTATNTIFWLDVPVKQLKNIQDLNQQVFDLNNALTWYQITDFSVK